MTAGEIHTKIRINCGPRLYAPKAGQTPATVLCNTNYPSIFRKVAKTYHEDQMIGRMFPPLISWQSEIVRHRGHFCLHLIVRRLRAEGTSAFRDKVPGTANMYNISAFLSTLPGYLHGQDS